MSYTITAIDPVLGGALLRVKFTQDGGKEERAFFDTGSLRRRTEGLQFGEYFPLWLRAQAAGATVDLKTVTLAQLRSFAVGKVLPALPTADAARTLDGV